MPFGRRVVFVALGYVALALGAAEALFGVGDPLEGRFGEMMLGLSALYVIAATGWLAVHWLRWSGRRP